MSFPTVYSHLQRVRRRLWMIGGSAALAWAATVAIVLLLCGAWFDLLWELAPQGRIALLIAAALAGLVGLTIQVTWTGGDAADRRVARRLDRAGHCGGEVVTGWELEVTDPDALLRPVLRAGLARLAVERAAGLAERVPASQVIPARPLGRAAGVLAILLAAVGLLVLALPGLARTQWQRFADPFADVPPFSRTQLRVQPGDVSVVYGNLLEILAEVEGPPVDPLEIVLEPADGQGEVLPMFSDAEGRWRATLTRITVPATYYVRAPRVRSAKYHIQVITVPRIESVRVRVTPPAYTGLPPYEGPVPKDGLAGLRGAEILVTAKSNRPLASGTIAVTWAAGTGAPPTTARRGSLTPPEPPTEGLPNAVGRIGSPARMEDGRQTANPSHEVPETFALQPATEGSQEAQGKLAIVGNGKLELHVTDTAGQRSQDTVSATITLLRDQRPLVRLLQPQKQSLATPEATLPVRVAAEDDYGVARLQLFRNLNDSRPRPTSLPVPPRPPRRLDAQVELPLAQYRLVPGDVIKLFGRVEDNDPAGAKGSESEVVTVRIISQEEFDRMLRIREGLNALMAKYAEARRRMESLADETKQLQKKTADQPPDRAVDDETRQQTQRLLERLRRESEALRRLAQHKLPYDADQNLSPELEQLAQLTDRLAEELDKLLQEAELHRDLLERQLQKLAGELAAGRDQFQQHALLPLELLETVFPLVADQSRFVMLALRQIDLAERLASLQGRDGEDDPARKARMRDLEQEQREIREALQELLQDIQDHARQLPDEEQYAELRRTATEFVKQVRASGALAAMAEAEAALAEFAGGRAATKAREAADILRKFIAWCEEGGMAECAGGCLVFQPSLSNCLGNTISQLLAMMGLSSGSGGSGGGVGGAGGYSAYPGGWQNLGLYGASPGLGDAAGTGHQQPGASAGEGRGGVASGGKDGDASGVFDPSLESAASGTGEGQVPVRYRQRVGQYFRRLAEELEGK